ncbi:LysR family transcriptional regulator [Streptomyces sp. LBUM 1478]|nr:LysR family transcriptional regulator [Streptomyces sp. LBUM 1478]
MTGSEAPSSFRLAYVPGVTPTKWVRIWNERLPDVPLTLLQVSPAEAFGVLRDGGADAGFVRLPVDGDDLSAIPLYAETTVVVVPRDHVVAAVEEVTTEDLADEVVLHPLDDTLGWERPPGEPAFERPATTADAIELVAAGIGLLIVPQSLARLHHRKDLTYRTVTDAPESRVALSWPQDATTDLVEDFIGIVRAVRSTPPGAAPSPRRRRSRNRSPGVPRRTPPAASPRRPGASGTRRAAASPESPAAAPRASSPLPRRPRSPHRFLIRRNVTEFAGNV